MRRNYWNVLDESSATMREISSLLDKGVGLGSAELAPHFERMRELRAERRTLAKLPERRERER